MKTSLLYKLTGASAMALGLAVTPAFSGAGVAQTTAPAVETEESAGQNFEESEEALERAGAEAVQGVEAAGEAAQEDLRQAAQEASRATEAAAQDAQQAASGAAEEAAAAAERAELAAESAAENIADIEEGFDWGWLGLFGLIGLFGLAGGNKRQTEVDERYRQPTTTPSGDYR